VSDADDLYVRQWGQRFAVLHGKRLMALADTQLEAETARAYYQGQIEAGEAPVNTAAVAAKIEGAAHRAEIDGLKAEIDALRNKLDPSAILADEPWRSCAKRLVLNAPDVVRRLPLPRLWKWAVEHWAFHDVDPPGRTVFIQFMLELRALDLLPQSRRRSRK
jgi:hypothetical protein